MTVRFASHTFKLEYRWPS